MYLHSYMHTYYVGICRYAGIYIYILNVFFELHVSIYIYIRIYTYCIYLYVYTCKRNGIFFNMFLFKKHIQIKMFVDKR